MNIIIEKAKIEELGDVQSLGKKLMESEIHWIPDDIPGWFLSEDGREKIGKRVSGETGVVYVAKHDGKIVGYILATLPDKQNWRVDHTEIYVLNFFVEEKYRNQGIGDMLMKEIEKWAKEKGVTHIKLEMVYENEKAEKFYTRHGFKHFAKVLEKKL